MHSSPIHMFLHQHNRWAILEPIRIYVLGTTPWSHAFIANTLLQYHMPLSLPSHFTHIYAESEEPDPSQLESLRAHLRKIFGGSSSPEPRDPPSPIDPDELEITGVKESKSSSSSSSSSTTSSSSSSKTPTPSKEKAPQLECAICLGEMKKITATNCGHVFCYECIKTAIQVTKCCPMCKKRLNLRSIHPLYLSLST